MAVLVTSTHRTEARTSAAAAGLNIVSTAGTRMPGVGGVIGCQTRPPASYSNYVEQQGQGIGGPGFGLQA